MNPQKKLMALVNCILLITVLYGCYAACFQGGSTDKSILLPMFYLPCLFVANVIFLGVLYITKSNKLIPFQWNILIVLFFIIIGSILIFMQL